MTVRRPRDSQPIPRVAGLLLLLGFGLAAIRIFVEPLRNMPFGKLAIACWLGCLLIIVWTNNQGVTRALYGLGFIALAASIPLPGYRAWLIGGALVIFLVTATTASWFRFRRKASNVINNLQDIRTMDQGS